MAGFLTDFLSLGSGALAAQALYFLFVKYPFELRRLRSELDVMSRQLELASESWNETFDGILEAHSFAGDLLANWTVIAKSEGRTKTRLEIEETAWTLKALHRVDGEPIARTLGLLEGVLDDMGQALLKEGDPTVDDQLSLMAHANAIGKSARELRRAVNATSLLDEAKIGVVKNQALSFRFLSRWARIGLLVYGLMAALAAAMAIARMDVRWHSLLASAAAIVLVASTIAVVGYSYYQERTLEDLFQKTDGKEAVGGA